MESKNIVYYLQNRNRVTDVEHKLMVTRVECWEEINWETGVEINILL